MSEPRAFIPPEFHLPTAWALDAALPAIMKAALNLDAIDISREDRRLLRTLRHGRLLYMSNHPSTVEPPVAYAVANAMGSRFHYMASRVVFNWYGGILGEIIRRLGAFSVLAGAGDRESIRTARRILAAPDGKLVIYPEGMMSGENDNLLTFMPGAMQLAFWGLEDARKTSPAADIPVLCAFVKYLMSASPRQQLQEIEESLRRLEFRLGIDPGGKGLLRRFLTIGRVLLEQSEREYHIPMASETDYEYRVGRARHAALNAAAETLGIELDVREDALGKMRALFAAVESMEAGFPGALKHRPDSARLEEARRHMERAYTFLVVRREYLLSRPTAERCYEWLTRFETVVHGESKPRPRRARLLLARPFYIGDYYEAYKENRRHGMALAMERVRRELENLMARGALLSEPIVPAYQIEAEFRQ
ncbi:MAG: 1-acyl-sn-glycerol-3-phosphate acyltransferase [Leptospirales bacterium]|nr:1-acyl-sn-glycerol-3-phosphate acyltransferase [Leptospirales bacterium]